MKDKILKILIVVVVIIIVFFSSFFIAINFLDMTDKKERSNAENNTKNVVIEETFQNEEEIRNSIEANSFEGIIEDINGNEITVENPEHLVYHEIYHGDYEWRSNHKVIIDGKIYVKAGYLMNISNVPIKDSDGKNIKISDLKVGDIINVQTKDIEYNASTIFETLTSENIVLIEKK